MPSLPAFQKFQKRFAAHIRDPQNNPKPVKVPVRRMRVYNELLFNNIEDVLAGCCPVLKSVLSSEQWLDLVRDFFSSHRCLSHYYREVPAEFVRYLQSSRPIDPKDPPFLKALAHYEWIELKLYTSAQTSSVRVREPVDWISETIVCNPVLEVLTYPFAVHEIGPDFIPSEMDRGDFHYCVFRSVEDQVEFIVINAVTAELLRLLAGQLLPLAQHLARLNDWLKHPDPAFLQEAALQMVQDLYSRGALLGVLA